MEFMIFSMLSIYLQFKKIHIGGWETQISM